MKKMFYISLMFIGFGAESMNDSNSQLATVESNSTSTEITQTYEVKIENSSEESNSVSHEVCPIDADKNEALEYKIRVLEVTYDDISLLTRKKTQTFYVDSNGVEKEIKIEITQIPYTYIERTEDRWFDNVHDRRYIIRDYVRDDGTTFSKQMIDLGLIVKRPPAPIPISPIQTQEREPRWPPTRDPFQPLPPGCKVY